MADRVTIQDIADALGISRNTVSKAINNTGILADATRDKVLKKAMEMGYKQFSYITLADSTKPALAISPNGDAAEIALFTTSFLGNSHFSSTMLDKFQNELSGFGYSLSMHRIRSEELKARRIPSSFSKERTAGIACIELFDPEYSRIVCSLGLPVLFIDSHAVCMDGPPEADCLYMDNQTGIYQFVHEMVRRGKKKIGFIGEVMHCQSFYERYAAYRDAMHLHKLPCPEEYCILENKKSEGRPYPEEYKEYLEECIKKLPSLPDVFICANDFVAIDTMQILKKAGYSIPKDVYLCGFDDSQESKIITPSLTTIHIHSQIMGYSAVQLLVSRIREPSLNYRTMHTETSLIYRESTEDE